MIPRELLATASLGGQRELRLVRRGDDFMIVLDRNELMNSRMSGSEEALATMTCDRLRDRAAPHLLIGGYGMGFTLRAALTALNDRARVTVVEVVPAIVDWARGPMRDLTAGCLDDRRVRLIVGDVAAAIRDARDDYDAILLDVDNGPDGLSLDENARLYAGHGLAGAMTALKRGGVLAVWSAGPDAAFALRLRRAGFVTEDVVVRARANGKGPRHVIWFATKA